MSTGLRLSHAIALVVPAGLVLSYAFDLEEVQRLSTDAGADATGPSTGGTGGAHWPEADSEPPAPDAQNDSSTGGSGAGPTQVVIYPLVGLYGDGFWASPDRCDQQVFDSYEQAGRKVLLVGRDSACGADATYRAFIRLPITTIDAPSSE